MPSLKLWDGSAWVTIGTAEGSSIQSQAEAESSTDTTPRLTTGQRLHQAIRAHTRVAAAPAVINTDLNTLTDSGWYAVGSTAPNAPTANSYFLEVRNHNAANTNVEQVARKVSDGATYRRLMLAGVWGAWQQDGVPRGTLGVTQITTQQTFATRNTIGLSVTVTVGTGRRIKVTHDTQLSHGSSGVGSYIYTMEGATQLLRRSIIHGTSSFAEPLHGEVILTPTAGTHTYHLEGLSSGTCTLNAEVGSPSFILVEDIGAA